MAEHGRVHIGTSGWHYPHWVGPFYPPTLGKDRFLAYYSRFFETVEINNSFYRLPEKKTFEGWRDSVPEDFIFAVKASRFITHMKRLKDPASSLAALMERVTGLGGRLGPILFQLPPRMRLDIGRLEGFLEALPPGFRYAFEFRDPAWFVSDVYRALERKGAAFCLFELAGLKSPRQVTAGFVYVRLHGPGHAYTGCYTLEALADWAEEICRWAREKKEVFFYFDNDELGYAVQNAKELTQLVTSGRAARDTHAVEITRPLSHL